MKDILVSPSDIQCCWEKNDACLVKMKTGKVWVCEKERNNQITLEFILNSKKENLVELPLKRGGKYGK